MVLAYKIVIVLLATWIFIQFYRMAMTGRANLRSNKNPVVVANHRKVANNLALSTVVLVILIEGGVRLKGGSEYNTMFWVHASFSGLYALSLVGLFFLPHGHNNKIHEYLAGFTFFAFFVSSSLGIPMLFSRFE